VYVPALLVSFTCKNILALSTAFICTILEVLIRTTEGQGRLQLVKCSGSGVIGGKTHFPPNRQLCQIGHLNCILVTITQSVIKHSFVKAHKSSLPVHVLDVIFLFHPECVFCSIRVWAILYAYGAYGHFSYPICVQASRTHIGPCMCMGRYNYILRCLALSHCCLLILSGYLLYKCIKKLRFFN